MTIPVSAETKRGCGYRQPGGLYLVEPADAEKLPCGGLPIPLNPCAVCGQQFKQARAFTWIRPIELFAAMGQACGSARCFGCPMGPENLPERAGLVWIGKQHYRTPEDFLAESNLMGMSRRIGRHLPREFWNRRQFSATVTCTPRVQNGELPMPAAVESVEVKLLARTQDDAEAAAIRQVREQSSHGYPHKRYRLTAQSYSLESALPPLVFVAHPAAIRGEDPKGSPGIFTSFYPQVERVVASGTQPDDPKVIADARKGIGSVKVVEV